MVKSTIKRIIKINIIIMAVILLAACSGESAGPQDIPDDGITTSFSSRSSSVGDVGVSSSASVSSQPVVTYRVQLVAEGEGQISFGSGNVCQGECVYHLAASQTMTFTAVPAEGFAFKHWQGDCTGSGACQLAVQKNIALTAVFEPKVVTPQSVSLLLNIDGEGQIALGEKTCSDLCSYRVPYNSGAQALQATPATGHIFTRWLGACVGQENPCLLSSEVDASATAVFSVEVSAPALASFTLINAQTNQPIAGYDPIATGAIINIDSLPTQQLNLRANTANEVGSVYFVLNNKPIRTESRAPYALASDDGAGDYNPWDLALGNHEVQATPYSQAGAAGIAGVPLSVSFKLVAVRMSADKNALNFDAVVGNGQAISRQLTLSNNGNDNGTFTVAQLPSWARTNVSGGTISAGQQQVMQITADACSETLERSGELVLTTDSEAGNTIFARVTLEQYCLPFTNSTYDLTLERVYFMQSTTQQDSRQSEAARMSLVANRSAWVRAFVTANRNERQPLPRVVLVYKQPSGQTGEIELTGASAVPTTIDESQSQHTFNATLSAANLQAGTQVYIMVDPDNQVAELNERNNRYPETGYWTLDAKTMPRFDITFVPVAINGELPDVNEAKVRELLGQSLALHPIGEYSIAIRAPYSYTGTSWGDIVSQISSLRRSDGSDRFYHGLVVRGPDGSNTSGIGYVSGKAAVSRLSQGTIAHELGHNFGRPHAPCGGVSGADSQFPYSNARTGVWGFDDRTQRLKSPENADYMSYCGPSWVSDYNYGKVLNALFNKQIRNKVGVPLWADENWQLEGVLHSEILSLNHWQQSQGTVGPHNPGAYWAKLLNANGDVLGQSSFGMTTLDHATEQHFYVSVSNDYAGDEVAAIAIGLGEQTLHRQIVTNGLVLQKTGVPLKPMGQQVNAQRLEHQRVSLVWPANGEVLTIKNSQGQVLARDKTGHVIVFTEEDELLGEINHQGVVTTFTISVVEGALF